MEKAKKIIERDPGCKEIEKIEILTNLAVTYAIQNNFSQAKEIIHECIVDFVDSPHRNLLVLANCEINILNNDVKTAIDILKNVPAEDPCYEVAKIKLGDIYLNKLK